jgi:hypothetical protein
MSVALQRVSLSNQAVIGVVTVMCLAPISSSMIRIGERKVAEESAGVLIGYLKEGGDGR